VRTIEETQRRLKAELTEAENYVRSILPPPGPTRMLNTAWVFQPSTELGGDSFGHHWIDDEHFAVYLLDVVGHGVAAALVSVTAINVLRSMSLPDVDFRDPGATLTALNTAFLMENQGDMYFTIWYGVWEPATRTLRFASAGHPPSLLLNRPLGSKAASIEPLRGAGLILGGMAGTGYRTHEKMIAGPARLYLLSDGVFEVDEDDGSMWGLEGLQEYLTSRPIDDSDAELTSLLKHVRGLNPSGNVSDDFSILRIEL
jgi:sigma-B regulation protein RsbU (phosphoserine phosphatase)